MKNKLINAAGVLLAVTVLILGVCIPSLILKDHESATLNTIHKYAPEDKTELLTAPLEDMTESALSYKLAMLSYAEIREPYRFELTMEDALLRLKSEWKKLEALNAVPTSLERYSLIEMHLVGSILDKGNCGAWAIRLGAEASTLYVFMDSVTGKIYSIEYSFFTPEEAPAINRNAILEGFEKYFQEDYKLSKFTVLKSDTRYISAASAQLALTVTREPFKGATEDGSTEFSVSYLYISISQLT